MTRVNLYPLNTVSISQTVGDYVKETAVPSKLYDGSQLMFGNMFSALDRYLPINEWLERKWRVDKSNGLFTEVLVAAGAVAIGAIFLPSAALTALMIVGVGSTVFDYSAGLYRYQEATLKEETNAKHKALERGKEAAFATVLGSFFLGLTGGLPKLANSQLLNLSHRAIGRLRSVAQAACLFDDPFHFFNASRQVSAHL